MRIQSLPTFTDTCVGWWEIPSEVCDHGFACTLLVRIMTPQADPASLVFGWQLARQPVVSEKSSDSVRAEARRQSTSSTTQTEDTKSSDSEPGNT